MDARLDVVSLVALHLGQLVHAQRWHQVERRQRRRHECFIAKHKKKNKKTNSYNLDEIQMKEERQKRKRHNYRMVA